MTGFQFLELLVTNFIAQVSADESKKGTQTTYFWYVNFCALMNAYYTEGSLAEYEYPGATTSDLQAIFGILGWPALGGMIDDYGSTDRWAEWPIDPAVPV